MRAAIQVLIGFLCLPAAAYGVLMFCAGAMSDNPFRGASWGDFGAALFVTAVLVFVLNIVAAIAMRPQKPGSGAP